MLILAGDGPESDHDFKPAGGDSFDLPSRREAFLLGDSEVRSLAPGTGMDVVFVRSMLSSAINLRQYNSTPEGFLGQRKL